MEYLRARVPLSEHEITTEGERTFHDAILALGAVPLPVLEQRMAQFIADGGTNPPR